MKDKILKTLKEGIVRKKLAWEEYRKACQEEDNKLTKLINFKGKFLKITDGSTDNYLYVENQIQCPYLNTDKPGLQLLGFGFQIVENFYFCLDVEFTHQLDLTNLENELGNIQEMTEEKFKEVFSEWQRLCSTEFQKYLMRGN